MSGIEGWKRDVVKRRKKRSERKERRRREKFQVDGGDLRGVKEGEPPSFQELEELRVELERNEQVDQETLNKLFHLPTTHSKVDPIVDRRRLKYDVTEDASKEVVDGPSSSLIKGDERNQLINFSLTLFPLLAKLAEFTPQDVVIKRKEDEEEIFEDGSELILSFDLLNNPTSELEEEEKEDYDLRNEGQSPQEITNSLVDDMNQEDDNEILDMRSSREFAYLVGQLKFLTDQEQVKVVSSTLHSITNPEGSSSSPNSGSHQPEMELLMLIEAYTALHEGGQAFSSDEVIMRFWEKDLSIFPFLVESCHISFLHPICRLISTLLQNHQSRAYLLSHNLTRVLFLRKVGISSSLRTSHLESEEEENKIKTENISQTYSTTDKSKLKAVRSIENLIKLLS